MGDKPVHLFTTELANQAIQVVKIDRFQNIVAFHCSLDETKRFLSNFAQLQQNSQNSLSKQQNAGSLDGGKLGCTNDMQGQILAPATTSSGRKFAPPPNVKLENPMQPPTPTGGFKREYNSLSSPFSDAPSLSILSGPLTPYGGADASNLPITDTHFGNYTSNGDPLEKMARLTQEALPYDPPLKQPKLEPIEACGASKSNAAGSAAACSNTGNNAKNSATDSTQSSASCDDQLTPSQRQHRLERLQTIEGLKLKKGTRFAQQPMPNFMPVMQCVPPPNVSLDVSMMPQGGLNMNPTNQASNFPARTMTPPNFGSGQTPRLAVGQPPPGVGMSMMQVPGPGPPPPKISADSGPPAPPPPTTVNEKRSRTPRSSTPKNKSTSSGGNQPPPAGVGPTTMMVQGKPAVMVHPNQTTKSSRTTNRSNPTLFPPQEKFFAVGGNGGPPNVTFGDPNFPAVGDNFQSSQQQNVAQILPDHYHQNSAAFFPNVNGGPPQWNAPAFCPPSNNPSTATAAAATLVFNHAAGGAGGPRAAPPPANLNLNMNIQINAQPSTAGGGQDLMMGGGGGHAMPGQHMQSSLRFMAPGGNDFMTSSRVDDEIFYDPMPFGNRNNGQGLCPPPPNVNIAVTGIYPPPQQQQQGPPCFMGNQGGGGPPAPNSSFFQCNNNLVDVGQDFGGQMMNNEQAFFQHSNNFSMLDAACRPNDLTFQQRKTSMPPGSFTMSIHHNLNMQNGPYNPMSPQMAPWPQQQQLCRPQTQGSAPGPPQQPFFPMRGAAPRPHTASTTFDDIQKSSPKMPPSGARNTAAGPLSDPQNVQQQQQYDAQYKNFQQQLYSSNNNGPTST